MDSISPGESATMESYVRFVIRFRIIVLAMVGVITLGAGYWLSNGIIATSLATLFLGESPEYQKYVERSKEFGGDGIIAIGFHQPELFSTESLTRLKKITERIRAHSEIERVDSVLDASRMTAQEGNLDTSTYADLALADPSRARQFLDELLADPLSGNQYVSKDGQQTIVFVELKFTLDRPVETEPLLVQEILDVFVESGFKREELHLAGIIPVMSQVVDETFFNLTRLFPIVNIVLLLVVFIMFRRLWPVFITFGVGSISVIWAMAFAVMMDPKISILMAMAPAVLLIVSFSDVIHLCSAYLLELAQGDSKEDAILRSGTDVGKACVFTSLTTFAGFVSMSLIPAPVFRTLGLVLGVGVAVALLLAMTLCPILFSFMRQPKPWRRGANSVVQRVLDGFLDGVRTGVTSHPWATIGAFLAVAIASGIGLAHLHIDTDFSKRLGEDNPVRKDQRYFEEHFDGTGTLDIYVTTDEKEGILDPAVFANALELQHRIEELEGVDSVVSLNDVLLRVHDVMASATRRESPPNSRALLAQYMLLLEMSSDGYDLARLTDFHRQKLRLSVRMPEGAVRETASMGVKIAAMGESLVEPPAKVEATGSNYLMGRWLDEIIAGQQNGLLFAFVTIAIMMIIGLWSLRGGLWSMIPNAFPLIVLGGWMGGFWDKVDSDTIAVAMIAIGIGVDDTIHFLTRFKLESERLGDWRAALENTFHFSGRAIVITSVVLIAGFAPFAISDYMPLHIMGTMLPLCLFVALVADLMLVPALVQVGAIRFGRGNTRKSKTKED